MKALVITLSLLMAGCFAQKKVAVTLHHANELYYLKEYEDAFDSYSQVIEHYTGKGQIAPGDVYNSAGKCLYYTGSKKQAVEYFNLAVQAGIDDEQALFLMIKYYEEIDNLSKELECLEKYDEVFSHGAEIKHVNERLFIRYVDMKEWHRAYSAFDNLDKACLDRIDILEKYYMVNEKLDNKLKAEEVARKLYNMDPNNLVGLSFVARSAYDSVEKEYVAAVKAYEAKKTTANYNIMKKKVEPLAARYKTAKNYYIRLYNLYKRPDDAAILSRICTRLNDKKGAKYYENLSKK